MATLSGLVDRVRMEIGDQAKSFVWKIAATGTNRYEIPYSPINGTTLKVFVGSTDVSAHVEAEEHTGVITFDTAPTAGLEITAQGTYYRFFTDAELCTIVDAAAQEHLYHRTDAFSRKLTITNLPTVEEYPLALLATVQALMTLATDASFDINIQTPDGVSIPRSERYRQLTDIARERKAQYDTLCEALNIGITRIEVFSLRRISTMTNQYVPLFIPQEIDDYTPPSRIYLPIPTYGSDPVPSLAANYDLVFTQGDDFSAVLDFPFDVTGYTPKAQIRLYPESAEVTANLVCDITDAANGKITISLTAAKTTNIPLKAYWDMQLTSPDPETFTETYLRGQVFCVRQITNDVNAENNPNWSPTGWEPQP